MGLNADDIRRAKFDHLASQRFPELLEEEVPEMVDDCRQLFDLKALKGALVAEINSFNADSASDSLSRLFVDWCRERFSDADAHTVLNDILDGSGIPDAFVMALLEDVFLGQVHSLSVEHHHNRPVSAWFA